MRHDEGNSGDHGHRDRQGRPPARQGGGVLGRRGKVVPEDARRHNRSLILQTLLRAGPRTRADLARSTALTPPTVSDLVAELVTAGLVEEIGRQPTRSVGKPATLVAVVPDARTTVCLDLSDDKVCSAALVDLAGKITARRVLPRHDATGAGALRLVLRLATEMAAQSDRPVLGIGVGTPGIVDRAGTVVNATNLGWQDVPLAAELSNTLGYPTYVENDANVAALAEYTFGESSGSNMLLLRIDEGVGAGILLDGRLFTGDGYAAGEVGHVVVDERGQLCTCGKRGCLETFVAVPHLSERVARDGDASRTTVLRAAGRRLGIALATVVSTLNLSDVVLSGPSEWLAEPLRDAALRTIRSRTLPIINDGLVLRLSSLGEDEVLLGASVLVVNTQLAET